MKMKRWLKCLLMTMALMMTVNAGMAVTTVPAAAKTATVTVKKGAIFWKGNYQYKVASLKSKKGTATLIGAKSKVTSVNVPETVNVGKYTLTVTAIGSNAFKDCKKLETVVTNKSIKEIGKNAFKGCKKLAAVDIKSRALKKVGKDALKGISAEAVITVPDGKDASYEKLLKTAVQTPAEAVPETQPETAAPETQPETAASETQPETKAAETQPETAAPETQPETKAPETQPETAAPETQPETAAPETQPETAAPETQPETTAPETQPETAALETQPETAAPETQPETAAPETQPETAAPETQPETETKVVPMPAPEITAPAPKKEAKAQEKAVCDGKKHLGLVVVESVAPTCTKPGQSSYEYCTVCGYRTEPISISAVGHSFGDWSVVKAATCTEAGTEERICEACEEKESRVVAAKGHTFGDWRQEPIPTSKCYCRNVRECTVCGYEEKGNSVVHREDVYEHPEDIQATCTTPGKTNRTYCPYCRAENFSYVKPLGHKFCTEELTQDATCTADGCVYRKCERCDERRITKILPKLEHAWEDKTEPATCTNDGFMGKECSVCHAKEGSIIRAVGHQYEITMNTTATCTEDGIRTETCSKCHAVRMTETPAVGHKWVEHKEKAATCGEAGHNAYTQCSRCGAYENGKERKDIPALSHSWAQADASRILQIAMPTEETGRCNPTSFERCKNCHTYRVIPGTGHCWIEDSEGSGNLKAACGFKPDDPSADGYIQWTVFLTETSWKSTKYDGRRSSLWMGDGDTGRSYAAYIPTLRSTVQFEAPVPECPEGKTFAGWKQVMPCGNSIYGTWRPGYGQIFGYRDAYRTYVAVFE